MLIGIWRLLLLTSCHKRVKPFSWKWPAVRRVGWPAPCNKLLGVKMWQSAAHTGTAVIWERTLVRLVMSQVNRLKPKHVYISPECGPYSPVQNMNQRSEQQKRDLEEKRRLVLKQYVGACCVYQHCVQSGVHVTWEWSERCQGWRLPIMQNLQQKYGLFTAVVYGCQVNLRHHRKADLMKKGWKLMTTHRRVAEFMRLPCRCPRQYQHAVCEGDMARKTAYYTPTSIGFCLQSSTR